VGMSPLVKEEFASEFKDELLLLPCVDDSITGVGALNVAYLILLGGGGLLSLVFCSVVASFQLAPRSQYYCSNCPVSS